VRSISGLVTWPAHEDRHIIAIRSPNMATAVYSINKIGCAHLLKHVVTNDGGGYYLIFKDDSWLKQQWREHFPQAEIQAN